MSFGNVEQNIDEGSIRAEEREKVLKEVYRRLKKLSHLIWQSPQSCGQRNVVDWSDIDSLFIELRK